jgi:hypothetical protein
MAKGEQFKESKGKKPKDKADKMDKDDVPAYKKGGAVNAGIPKGKK